MASGRGWSRRVSVLYQAVQSAWRPFVGAVESGERTVPRFCRRDAVVGGAIRGRNC